MTRPQDSWERFAYGPALAASGVATGVANPINTLTELSPIFAVHTLPLASTAIPAGEFSEPNPALPVIAEDPEKAEIEAVFAKPGILLPVDRPPQLAGSDPPPDTGLEPANRSGIRYHRERASRQ